MSSCTLYLDRLFTFAISLQLLPVSRICLSLCSSPADQGVLVLPRFLPLSSVSKAGIDTFVLDSVGADGVG